MTLLDDLRAAVRPQQSPSGGPATHGIVLGPWEPRRPPLTPTCDARAVVFCNGHPVARIYRLTITPQPFQYQDAPPDPGPIPPFIDFQLHDFTTDKPLASLGSLEALLDRFPLQSHCCDAP